MSVLVIITQLFVFNQFVKTVGECFVLGVCYSQVLSLT